MNGVLFFVVMKVIYANYKKYKITHKSYNPHLSEIATCSYLVEHDPSSYCTGNVYLLLPF